MFPDKHFTARVNVYNFGFFFANGFYSYYNVSELYVDSEDDFSLWAEYFFVIVLVLALISIVLLLALCLKLRRCASKGAESETKNANMETEITVIQAI